MKIKSLEMENYAPLLSGLQRKKIKIDFTKSKNRIVLIIGDNGTCKTFILSQLQPFALPIGDVRSNKTVLLREDDDETIVPAYKRIVYDVDGKEYDIRHFIDKKGTIKSYISEDGTELNANGNVTSFKDVIEAVLDINEDTIQLMRLGTNTSTFLKKSSGERKAFIGDLLNDISIYAKLYKKINEDFRVLRGLIKNVSNKIDSLNIGDLSAARGKMLQIDETISNLNRHRDDLISEIGATKSKVDNMTDSDVADMRSELTSLKKEVTALETLISKLDSYDLKEVSSSLAKTKEILNINVLRVNTLETNLISSRDKLNDLHDEADSLTTKIQMIQSSSDVGDLSQLLLKVDNEIKELDEKFSNFNTSASLEDFKRLLEIYKDIEHKVSISHGFDNEAIREIITMYLEGVNVDTTLNDQYRKYTNKVDNIKAKIVAQRNKTTGASTANNYIIFKDNNCNCNCPFEAFYDEVTAVKTDDHDLEKDLKLAANKLDVMDDKFAISSNLLLIKMVVDANKTLIDRLPSGLISFEKILQDMYDAKPIYDEAYITRFITMMEDYENIDTLREKRLEIKEELSKMRGNDDTLTYMNNELIKHRTAIDKENEKIKQMEYEIGMLEPDIQTLSSEQDHLEELKHSLDNLEHSKERLQFIRLKINDLHNSITLYEETDSVIDRLRVSLSSAEQNIRMHNSNRLELSKRIDAMVSLEEELKILENKFERLYYIRDSLSSTKGVPLVYIELYMMDINVAVNKLLREVYGDSIEIKEFIINDKEFTIPYVKNGVYVPDISMASQGEEAFICVAFSFAFMHRSFDIYNIITMDEVDGPLDTGRREKFINTIEERMDKVKAEQAIFITHNNAFDSYPVDVIMTSPVKIDSYTNINVIFEA